MSGLNFVLLWRVQTLMLSWVTGDTKTNAGIFCLYFLVMIAISVHSSEDMIHSERDIFLLAQERMKKKTTVLYIRICSMVSAQYIFLWNNTYYKSKLRRIYKHNHWVLSFSVCFVLSQIWNFIFVSWMILWYFIFLSSRFIWYLKFVKIFIIGNVKVEFAIWITFRWFL
jgi:hypothetical protein